MYTFQICYPPPLHFYPENKVYYYYDKPFTKIKNQKDDVKKRRERWCWLTESLPQITLSQSDTNAVRRDDAGRACRDTEHKASGRLPRRTPPHATPRRTATNTFPLPFSTIHFIIWNSYQIETNVLDAYRWARQVIHLIWLHTTKR